MRNSIDKIGLLRQTNLFFNLSDPILRTVAACTITRHLRRGEVLYYQHEEASALYVVGRGELRSIRQNTDGREQVLSTERAGAILAAVCICDGGQCHSTVTADTSSEVLSIAKCDIQDLCRKHSDLVWNLAGVLARQVRDAAELIEALALRDVDQRVAQYVLTA